MDTINSIPMNVSNPSLGSLGSFEFLLPPDSPEGNITVYCSIVSADEASLDGGKKDSLSVTFSIEKNTTKLTDSDPPIIPIPIIAGVLVFSGLFACIWLSERGRYLLFSMIVLPLYTRLKNDVEKDLRQQNNRGRIYQHIKDYPGVTLNLIKNAVETGNGTTVYHLKKLQGNQIVIRKGKQYYIKSARPQIFGKMKRPLKYSEENIVQYLQTQGQANESIMSQQFNREQPTINRDLKSLMASGVVTREKTSGAFHYSLTSTFEKWHEAISREQQQQMIDETKYVEPMICPSCGKEITLKGATFCPFCSRNLN